MSVVALVRVSAHAMATRRLAEEIILKNRCREERMCVWGRIVREPVERVWKQDELEFDTRAKCFKHSFYR